MTVIVSLLTDFGLTDTYVGQMKASVLAVAPAATLVDLTHAVPPQDVFGGAFQLWSAVETVPPGSVHLAVVDPGVGSARRAVAARAARGDYFVGPDNGLLVPALDRLGGCVLAIELTRAEYWRAHPSGTFHGRDIFGPVAGHLASGEPLEKLGGQVSLLRPFELHFATGRRGQVIHTDAYGNLITNLAATVLPEVFTVRIAGRGVPRRPHYAAVQAGELLALVGSSGLIEISARNASAASVLGVRRGDPVEVEPR